MPTAEKSKLVVSFADYVFNANRILTRQGVRRKLKNQSAQLLSLLLDRAGEVVTREEIRNALWDEDTFVDFDQGINNCIREIRFALNDPAEDPQFIETVAKLGYRFLAPVNRRMVSSQPAENVPSQSTPEATAPVSSAPGRVADVPNRSRAGISRKEGFLAAAIALVILGGITWASLRFSRSVHAEKPGKVTIAVMPFSNLTGVPDNEYLTEGLTESVIDDLSRTSTSDLKVIARTSSNELMASGKTVEEIAHELGANYVVQGQLESNNDHLKVTAKLVRMRDGSSIWTYKGDWTTDNIMRADTDISHEILRKLAIELPPTETRSSSEVAHMNPQAYRAYLLGRHDLNERSRDSLLRATEEFKKAIEEEPDSGAAYAGLAIADNLLAYYGGAPFYKSVVEAERQARHAIQIDDSLAEAHAALAYSEFMWGWQWSQAEAEFRRALALNPNYAAAHHWYALYLAAMGRFQEAQREIRIAQQLDPLSAIVYAGSAYVDYMARDYNGAIQQANFALDLNSKLMAAHAVLGWTYCANGNPEKAITAFRTADKLAGGSSVYSAGLARAYALAGQSELARSTLATLERTEEDGFTPSLRAQVLESLGERQAAIALLYKAYELNDPSALWLKVDPQYDPLRSEAKFQALLKRMQFPD